MWKEIYISGFRVFTDAVIYDDFYLYFVSLFARPMIAKAVSAAIVGGREVWIDYRVTREYGSNYRILSYSAGHVAHKIVYAPDYFKGEMSRKRILIGRNIDAAFDFVNSIFTTPLKSEWKEWIWENALNKRKIHSFGQIGETALNEVYFTWPAFGQEQFDGLILGAISSGILK